MFHHSPIELRFQNVTGELLGYFMVRLIMTLNLKGKGVAREAVARRRLLDTRVMEYSKASSKGERQKGHNLMPGGCL